MNENVNNQLQVKNAPRTVFGFGSGTSKAAGQTPIKSNFQGIATPVRSSLKKGPAPGSSAKKLFTTSQQVGVNRPQSSNIPLRTPLKSLSHSQSTSNLHSPTGSISGKKVSSTPNATPSKAFEAREAARVARIELENAKIMKTKELKEKWAREKAEKMNESEQIKLEKIQLARKMSEVTSAQQQQRLIKRREQEALKKEQSKAELQTRLDVERESKEIRKAQKKENRRKSILARDYIRKQQQKAAEEEDLTKKQAAVAEIQAKAEDHKAVKEAKKMNAKQRRQSLFDRGLITVQHKAKKEQDQKQALKAEQEQLEFKRLEAADVANYKASEKERQRRSMESRNEAARILKELELEEEQNKKQEVCKDLHDKHADWLALQETKKGEKEARRASIAARNDYYFNHVKDVEARAQQMEMESAEVEALLKQQELEDVAAYRKQQTDNRRQSLAHRLYVVHAEHKDVSMRQKAMEAILQEEDQRLKQQDLDDITHYKKAEAESKRQSLINRGLKKVEETELMNELTATQKAEQAAELARKHDDWMDVVEYKKAEAESKRQSLINRGLKKVEETELMNELTATQKAEQAAELARKHDDWMDVVEYKKAEAESKRQSLINRGLKKVEETELMNELTATQKAEQAAEFALKHDDWMDVQDSVSQQRAGRRQSLAQRLVKSKLDKEMDIMQHQDQLAQMHEEFELKRLGNEDVAEYQTKQKESRRNSLAMRLQSHKEYKLQQLKAQQQEEIKHDEDLLLQQADRAELRKYQLAMKQNAINELVANKPWN